MSFQSEAGDSVTDSEKIRILPATTGRNNDPAKRQQQQLHIDCQDPCSSSLCNDSTAGSFKRKQVRPENEEYSRKDSAFYNMGFTLSPSDLERSLKQPRTSMNGSISDDGIRRSKSDCTISVYRQPIDNSYLEKKCGPLPLESNVRKTKRYISTHCGCNLSCILSFFMSLFPVLSWLPKYKREYILPDIIAGFTISILHLPQGMAYGVLASVKPENGLYVSFFPVLVYFILGTSRHISIGTFAVISLMLSNAAYNIKSMDIGVAHNTTVLNDTHISHVTSLEVMTTLAISVGFIQIAMGIFQLGSLSVVLSDHLISGFSTGAACHVATSQLKDLFGIKVGRYGGSLQLIYTLRDIFLNLVHTNTVTVGLSAVALFVLAFFKEQIDTRLKGRLKIPIPIDLIVVVIGTTVSYFLKLDKVHNVSVIQEIPTGLPVPVSPRLDLFMKLIGDSIAVAVVSYVISLSMAKLLSKKHNYSINANQELLAIGGANVFSSFFSCYPCSASLSRSLVQERAGGKTQVAGLVSCGILLIVLLALAPLFYALPKAILSCIILVALKPMFLQVKDFWNAWKVSKLDALIWLVTCLSTIFLTVTYGLVAGVVFSLFSVIARTVIPTRTFLGRVPNTDIYLDVKRYELAHEIRGIKIFHFENALYFINKELFKAYLHKHIPLTNDDSNRDEKVHRIVIDCSTFSFIDLAGLDTLLEIMKEYQEAGISVYLAACSMAMKDVMAKAQFYEQIPIHPSIFPTIHDAVEFQYFQHALSPN